MQRRGFLQLGLFGSSLLALGGVGLALFPSKQSYAPTGPLRAIRADRFSILASVAARVVTAPGADAIAIAHRFDEAIWRGWPELADDLNAFLGLLESGLAGLILDGRPQPFTRLSPAGQDAALAALRDSRFQVRRSGYHAIRKLCLAGHYSLESCWSDVGYPGPPWFPPPVAEAPQPAPAAPIAGTTDGGTP